MYHAKINQKKAGITVLITENIYWRRNYITRSKKIIIL